MNKTPWVQGVYSMFGKPVNTPRLLWAMKDPGIDITKSYDVTDSSEWTSKLKAIKNKIETKLRKCKFNEKFIYAQINYYRNCHDYIGWHTDSEVYPGDLIASLSLGRPHRFVLRHKKYAIQPIAKH